MGLRANITSIKNLFSGNTEINFVYSGLVLIYKSITQFVTDYVSRVTADGGFTESTNNVKALMQSLRDKNVFDEATFVMIPSGTKSGRVYSELNANGDLTFTRASTATRVNSAGLIESAATGVPRIDHSSGVPSLLLEPQRTNVLLNSATLSTQNVTTSATTYTLSFYGTGTVTLSGTATGNLVGTGVNNRVTLTFAATAGTLTATVSGSVTSANLEIGSYATSYIPTTTATVTRVLDMSTNPMLSNLQNFISNTQGTVFIETNLLNVNEARTLISFSQVFGFVSLADGRTAGRNFADGRYISLSNRGNGNFKLLIKYNNNVCTYFINGVNIGSDTLSSTPNFTTMSVQNNSFGQGSQQAIKQMVFWNKPLTDAQCIALTQ